MQSLSSSDGVTNALVEAALVELEQEESESGPKAALVKQGSVSSSRGSGAAEALQSPIRVTPAASRQVSNATIFPAYLPGNLECWGSNSGGEFSPRT